jgi:hypothetical protein
MAIHVQQQLSAVGSEQTKLRQTAMQVLFDALINVDHSGQIVNT